MTVTDANPAPEAPAIPLFGRRTDTLETRAYRRFGLEVEGRRDPSDRQEARWSEEFDAFVDVDGGQWVAMGNARTELGLAQAVIRFLATNLRDDDGCPLEWSVPVTPAVDPEAPEDAADPWLRDDETGDPLYEWWDGSLYLQKELPDAVDELSEGSSRRRFGYISDAMDLRYKMDALEEISAWLTQGATGRPTRRPAPSGRGPTPTARGSKGRRH